MSTLLDKNIAALSAELGREVEVLQRGVTGGCWPQGTAALATNKERSNCAQFIREHGVAEVGQLTTWYRIPGARVVTGAGYGGCRGHKAKQVWYAIVR